MRGIRAWATVRKEIVNRLKEDTASTSTTMVDFYGLPDTGWGAWPGRSEAHNLKFPNNAETVENAIAVDIYKEMGSGFNCERFIPYLMIHEFEAMLFSDSERFAEGIGQPKLAPKFQGIRDKFGCPEEIDDSPQTAPPKRFASLVSGYQTPFMGTLASLEIGLTAIRSACPHFRSWLKRLECTTCQMDA